MSARRSVFLTRELPPGPMERLRAHVDLRVNPNDRALTRAELIEGVRDQDALLCQVTDAIDGEVLDAAPDLVVVANYAVGYDNVDVAAASERGVAVTNTPDVLTDATADMAFALLLAVARRVVEGDALVRSGDWAGWGPLHYLGGEVSGTTLGLIGLGRIGKAMVPRARGFGMNVLYWNRTRLSEAEERELELTYADRDDVLREARFVSLHVAANVDTHHLIDARAIDLIGPDGYLINAARGTVVDERALVRALQEGRIAGAGLDVFEREPELEAGLAACANAVLTPHLGSATRATRTAMGDLAVSNVLTALRGERPPNLVNPDAFG